MKATLSLNDFGLTKDDVWSTVSSELHCSGEELLLACGSLVEGLGNSKSDLDLCLVTERAPTSINPATNRAVVIGDRLIADILFVHPDSVRQLAGALADLYSGDHSLRASAKTFSYVEHRAL
jgi:hypothetical protein